MPGLTTICPAQCAAVANDDWWLSFTLYEDGVPAVLTGASIQVGIRSLNDVAIVNPVVQSSASTGANWAVGLIIVSIPASATVALIKMEYFLEIQVLLNGRFHTWPLVPVEVIQATILH